MLAAGDDARAFEDRKRALGAAEEQLAQVRRRQPSQEGVTSRDQLSFSATYQVVRLQGRPGDTRGALARIEAIADPTQRDRAMVVLATARAGEGDLVAACDLINRIKVPERRSKAWIGVACALPAVKDRHP